MFLEFFRITQKFHDFLKLLFGLVDSSHIRECDFSFTLSKNFGLALAERHDPHPRGHPFNNISPDQEKNAHEDDPGEYAAQEFIIIVPGVTDLLFIQIFHQIGIIHPNRCELLILTRQFSFPC